MPLALTYEEVKALDPCEGDFSRAAKLLGGKTGWNGHKIDAAAARKAGCTFDDIVWVASIVSCKDADVERRLRLWAADCAAHVLYIHESPEKSEAPRHAILAARQFARGEIEADELNAAWRASSRIGWKVSLNNIQSDALNVVWDVAWDSAEITWGDEHDEVWIAAGSAWDTEQEWQFDRLIAWLSDDEPDDWPLPDRAQP